LLSFCLSCASLTPHFNGSTREQATVLEVQHAYSKKQSDCLAVCVDMVLNYYGVETIVPDTALPLDLISLSRSLNTDTPVDEEGHVLFATVLELSPDELTAHLAKKRPLIVAFKPSARKEYHGVVLSGYSKERERYFINDPARRKPSWRRLSNIPTFEDSGKYLVLLVGLSEK
jgi:ABC-type bacteriocin/lantibiotic exporter with double-glycine peptidase domain